MADDIKKLIEESGEKTRKEIGTLRQDINEVGVLVEAVQSDVKHIAETVDIHTKQLERLEPMEETLEEVKADVDAMKITLEAVNLMDLKQQVANLQKRMTAVEAKAR